MKETEIRKYLSKELKRFKDKSIHIVLTKPEDYQLTNMIILEILIKKLRLTGIYVTLNKPHLTISASLKDRNIDTSKLYFIDATGKQTGKRAKAANCSFIRSPESLTELSLAMTALANTGKFDFLFFDSLSTLLMYNDLETTGRFVHYMVSKIRNLNLRGIMISVVEEKSNKLIPVVSQFCDDIIKV